MHPLELRMKQKEASSRNGEVGSIGIKAPITPRDKDTDPKIIVNISLLNTISTMLPSIKYGKQGA